jgi:NAD(P)-dependent dehydrogenase (short-subunit alcohol dehydrogenase family)
MTGRLSGKTVIVTGAAHGIGAAVARSVAENGARVLLTDIDPAGANTAAEIGKLAEFHMLDVRDVDGWAALVARESSIDGLVNNAGVNVKYPPLEMPDAEWDRCLDINLRGVWNGCRAVLPTMVAKGAGSIVNIASVHGLQIIPASFPYPVAKHGLIGLTKSLGVEYAPSGVRVNAIAPGYVDTRLCQDWWNSQPDPADARAESEALIPARRIGRPEEIGMTAVFLLSDDAPYIVATTIEIDGGRLALYHA